MEALVDKQIITLNGLLQLRYNNINGFIVKPNPKFGGMGHLKHFFEGGLKKYGAMNPNGGFIRAKQLPYGSDIYYVFILDPADRHDDLYKQFAEYVSEQEALYILMIKDFVDVRLLDYYNQMLDDFPVVDTNKLPKSRLHVEQEVKRVLRLNNKGQKVNLLDNELAQPNNRQISDLALSAMQGYVIFSPPIYELND